MKRYLLSNIFILAFFLLGCKETVVKYLEKDITSGHIKLSSQKVEIGQKITANLNNKKI